MWKHLNSGDNVSVGDKIRFIETPAKTADAYTVVKAEQHYFQVMPELEKEAAERSFLMRIVRYFEIGYYLKLEIWIDS